MTEELCLPLLAHNDDLIIAITELLLLRLALTHIFPNYFNCR